MATEVYVMIGENGEYSDMTYTTVKVFRDKDAVETEIAQLAGKRFQWEVWHTSVDRELINLGYYKSQLGMYVNNAAFHAHREAIREDAIKRVGPEPEGKALFERYAYDTAELV